MIELNVILQLFTSSMSFQNLMKVNDVFSDDFRSESWFKLQINFETSIFIFETSRARGKTSRATRNVSVFYSFSGVRKYFDISFQSNTLDTVCSSKAGQCFFEVADGLNWTKKKDEWMSFCHGSFKVNNLHMHSFWMKISCSCFSLLLQWN